MRLINSLKQVIEQLAQPATQGMGAGVRGFLAQVAGLVKTSNPLISGFLIMFLLVLVGLGGLCAASGGGNDPLPPPNPKPQVIGPIVLCPGESWSKTLGPYRANVIAGPTSSNPPVATGSVTNGAGDIDVSDTITIKAHKEGTATISLTAAMWELDPMDNHSGGRFGVGHHRTGDIDILVKVPNCDPKKKDKPVPSATIGVPVDERPGVPTVDEYDHTESAPTATPTEAGPGIGQSGSAPGSFFDPVVELPLPTETATPESGCGTQCTNGADDGCGTQCNNGEDGCIDSGECGGGCVTNCDGDNGSHAGDDTGTGDCNDATVAGCGGCAHDCDGGESYPSPTPTAAQKWEPAPEPTAHDGCTTLLNEYGQCDGVAR